MPEEPPPRIRCENLWKVFGREPHKVIEAWDSLDPAMTKTELQAQTGCVVGVRHASFSVNQGEIFVLMGLSGSGKSSLIRCINRLNEPTKGKVFIDEQEVTALSPHELRELRRKKTGMVFQKFGLLPHRRVLENVGYGLEVQGVEAATRKAKSLEALELVGLAGWDGNFPHELSGGMQQRVGLARALATDPEILLMDEAFSALDPLIRRQMQDEFLKLIKVVKKTIVFVTHDLHEALRLADQIAVMRNGAIEQMGTPADIVLNPQTDYVATFVKDLPKMKFITAEDVMERPEQWLFRADEPVSQILKRMDANGLWYAFLAGENGRPNSVVDYHHLACAEATDKPVEAAILGPEFPQTAPKTFLEHLIPVAARTAVPIAVMEEGGPVRGFIRRDQILHAISTE